MAKEGPPPANWVVMQEILRYLIRHPDAKDTIEGILRWWFPNKRGAEPEKKDVQRAIDELVSRGWVLKRKTTHSQTIYGMNKDHLEAIKGFTKKSRGKRNEG